MSAEEFPAPVVHAVEVIRGIAGTVSALARVEYPGEETRAYVFAGSVYGGPVAYTFPRADGAGTVSGFVSDPGRFGEFGTGPEAWVRRFYA